MVMRIYKEGVYNMAVCIAKDHTHLEQEVCHLPTGVPERV